MDKKRMIALLIGLSVISTIGLASWIISLQGTITGNVVSDEASIVVWDTPLTQLGLIDTTNASALEVRTGVIQNNNGDLTFNFSSIELIEDDTLDVCDNTGDISISYKLNNATILSGDSVSITSGLNPVEVTYDIVNHACPQNVSVTLNFLEI